MNYMYIHIEKEKFDIVKRSLFTGYVIASI